MFSMPGARRQKRTAESVSFGHPDKYMDRVADVIVDAILKLDANLTNNEALLRGCRAAIEGVVKDNQLVLMGEVVANEMPDFKQLARQVWQETGYGPGDELAVLDYIVRQSPELTKSSRVGGAGDQGIMVGYATQETPEMLPLEFVLSRRILRFAMECREEGVLPWLRSDMKAQVSLDERGKVVSAVMAVQHEDRADLVVTRREGEVEIKRMSESAVQSITTHVLIPALADHFGDVEPVYTVNGAGSFVVGGPRGDAGEVGRKIVVDAYGPRVAVGGGAYSGKDPTKVDRSGAYMARFVAKSLVTRGVANECLVTIAYAIGKTQPEMVTAITDDGRDLSDLVRAEFGFSPWEIIERFNLWKPQGWSYYETATRGHYGNDNFPWEQV